MTGKMDVAYNFVRGHECHKGNVFTDGTTAYSYSFTYPIARRVDARTVLVNTESPSRTTSAHRNAIIRELASAGYRDIGEAGCTLEGTDAHGRTHLFPAQVWART